MNMQTTPTMLRKTSTLAACALSLLLAAGAYAAEAGAATTAPLRMPILQFLAAPPAPASEQARAELAQLHQIEGSRSAEQVRRAQADENEHTIFMYRTVFGDKFNAAALPLTAALSKRVGYDDSVDARGAKRAFARIRPYNLDKTLHPVCSTHVANDSYPSGHSTNGYLQALTLIEMVPEKRDEILARAADYARNRMVCGVHFPSDVEAGKLTAYSAHALLFTNPQLHQQLLAARQELRAALGLPLADEARK